jgi:putative endonuclease
MVAVHNKVGRLGEDIAAEFLKNNGFTILETNFTRKWGELDLITTKQDKDIVFVEVKTKRCDIPTEVPQEGDDAYRLEENVDYNKRKRLKRTIQTYLEENATGKPYWRVDILCVYVDTNQKESRINWLKNTII